MFDSSKLYNILKPVSNPTLITTYDVYIGGTMLPVNYSNGAIIIYALNSQDMTSQYKNMFDVTISESKEKGKSIIGITYQVDVFKKNSKNATKIEVESEALKIKEWLKSFEVQEYLDTLQSEILPTYSTIRFLPNEEINKEYVNRASFDFTIITTNEIRENVTIIDKINFDNLIILQGENTNE